MRRGPGTSLIDVLALPAMVGVGALVAVQSEINGRLAGELGSGARAGATAALVSFGLGLVLLGLVVALVPGPRAGVRRIVVAARSGRLHPSHLLGGVGGASLVASQGLAVGAIGVALFTVAMVAGQTVSGLLVDRAGIGPSGPHPISGGRVVGGSLTMLAVVLGVLERLGGSDAISVGVLALALLPLLAGASTAWQQAVNGQVAAHGGPIAAAFNNFVVGLVALLVFFVVVTVLGAGTVDALPTTWWLYLGGPVGVLFISLSARLVTIHGVLVLGLCTVAGLVVGSLLIDALGPESHLGVLTVLGAVLALVGVSIGAVASRRAAATDVRRSSQMADAPST